MRLAYYAGASTAAAAACLLKAFHQRPNYYSATVYLSQSNACLLILTNLCLVLACGFMYALQRLLYGPLRPIEIEQLSEKAWYAVLDTLLAMPSFREDVGGWLLTMFVLLLAGKVWGWIGEGRVDILEQQPPANPRLFHARLSTSLVLSVFFDMYMLNYCVETVLADPRPGMMVIFTFEFAIQSIFSTFTLCRYGLTVAETMIVKKQTEQAIEVRKNEIRAERAEARQNEANNGDDAPAVPPDTEPIEVDEQEVDVPGWEDKRRYLFVLEVVTDFIKLFIYMFFFAVSITFNGLPMHIMRDVYMTFASFSKRVTDYVAYRKATSDMNTRYPDATTEEIRGDACIVCRESMVSWNTAEIDPPPDGQAEQATPPPPTRRRDEGLRAKKLPCGHILHLRCLKAWLERQQVCPTCRRPVVTATSPNTPNAPAPIQGQGARQEPQGQQGNQQPAAPRPNRARIFNLGPIRVGLLNAPNAQLQNIVDQLRNPDAANQNAVAPANPEGANNPGLRAPNTDGQSTQQSTVPTTSTARGSSRGRRANLPIQIQLMQIEQRLIQEAHNLSIEQQQLATVRMLEAELARLRANYLPNQPAVGVQRPPIPQAMQGSVMSSFQAPQLLHSQPPPEILQGQSTVQYNSGDEGLPNGLVLPEGWSIMPLQRIGGIPQASQSIGAQTIRSESTQHPEGSLPMQSIPDASNTLPVDPAAVVAGTTAPPSEPLAAQSAAPTNENGSPLFVPTTIHASDNVTLGDQTRPNAPESSGTAQDEPRTLWAADQGWSFTDHPDQTASSQPAEAQADSGHTASQSEQQYSGKGKGKAVEIEDASDAEAGS